MAKIDSIVEKVGIVVQGPMVSTTYNLLVDLRALYPRNEIVFSSWEVHNFGKLKILSHHAQDPGVLKYKGEPYFRNLNRQIISTSEGLNLLKMPLAAKIRSDFSIREGANPIVVALQVWEQNKIVIDINRRTYPFHPWFISDWFQLAETELMKKLWGIRLASESDANYFSLKEISDVSRYKNLFVYPISKLPSRWSSEQYLCINLAQTLGHHISMENRMDVSLQSLVRSWGFISHTFTAISKSKLGLVHHHHFTSKQSCELLYWKAFTTFDSGVIRGIIIVLLTSIRLFFESYLFLKSRAKKMFLLSLKAVSNRCRHLTVCELRFIRKSRP